ncbi:hypothetical protein DE146DRAFT_758112 [Phaeosphaeria sp. MPI-PUGE-AT-0046c]|nr:hypothetical protein DE146DRAFT_758112 [Phaeosphaeria sp. MPI-PUGE-AT-0046c]
MSQDRNLRVLTLLTTALAFPLLIVSTALSFEGRNSGRAWWERPKVTSFCFGYIPLFFTTVAAIIAIRYRKQPYIRTVFLLDFAGAVGYVAVLVPIWVIEVERMNKGGLGLLVGYTTAPMVLNMFFHMYAFGRNIGIVCAAIFKKTERMCPHCHGRITVASPQRQETSKQGERYSLLRGEDYHDEDEDEDAVACVDASAKDNQAGVQSTASV